MRATYRSLGLVFLLGISGCASTMLNIGGAAFDDCRTQCSAIDWSAFPACVDPQNPPREVISYVRSLNDSLSAMDPPKGVCGCFTGVLGADGLFRDVEVVYSNWPDAQEHLTKVFREAEPLGPPPPDASCLVGLRVPGAFANQFASVLEMP
jgi:hypothetical protein